MAMWRLAKADELVEPVPPPLVPPLVAVPQTESSSTQLKSDKKMAAIISFLVITSIWFSKIAVVFIELFLTIAGNVSFNFKAT